jgi:hypothetical protein
LEKTITNSPRSNPSPRASLFLNLGKQARLVVRLMRDRRVSPFLKLLPIATLVYLFSPDVMIGPIDDPLVIWLGTVLFVELCPQDVVREHLDAINGVVPGSWREVSPQEYLIVDGEHVHEVDGTERNKSSP